MCLLLLLPQLLPPQLLLLPQPLQPLQIAAAYAETRHQMIS